jgi:hypothetical protein
MAEMLIRLEAIGVIQSGAPDKNERSQCFVRTKAWSRVSRTAMKKSDPRFFNQGSNRTRPIVIRLRRHA